MQSWFILRSLDKGGFCLVGWPVEFLSGFLQNLQGIRQHAFFSPFFYDNIKTILAMISYLLRAPYIIFTVIYVCRKKK